METGRYAIRKCGPYRINYAIYDRVLEEDVAEFYYHWPALIALDALNDSARKDAEINR